MDRESNRPRGRSGRDAQHLRDIAHLYLSGSRKPVAPPSHVSRRYCLGVTSAVNGLAKVDLCANMALQFARLGKRTLVIDLDASLPNVGFRMGLSPAFYLRHLEEHSQPCIERGPLGVRLLVGVPTSPVTLVEEVLRELREAECVLVNLPASVESLLSCRSLLGESPCGSAAATPVKPTELESRRAAAHLDPEPRHSLESPSGPEAHALNRRSHRTTMARAGERSRMFGQWLETAQRRDTPGQEVETDDPHPFDALLYVQQGPSQTSILDGIGAWKSARASARVHLVQWLQPETDEAAKLRTPAVHLDRAQLPWATLQAAPGGLALRHPSSLLYPEHQSSRLYESLAQSLLASGRSRVGGNVRAS